VIKLTVLRVDAALADFKLRSMHVIVHGGLSNTGPPVNWIAADVLRLKDGILVEHWDVIQDEATKQQSKSGNPMFGDSFPK
jgi:predicted SnoaL-like aldol condensation-catalyzing enzyme